MVIPPRSPANRLLAAVAVTVACVLIFKTLQMAVGESGQGKVDQPSEIPHVGQVLGSLVTNGPTHYSYFCHPHGGCACTLAGEASTEAIETFCQFQEAWSSLKETVKAEDPAFSAERDWSVSFVLDSFSKMGHPNGIDLIHVDDQTLAFFGTGDRYERLLGLFNPRSKRFAIYVSIR